MTQDRMTTLFFEMFTGLPQQGPGDAVSTLRAFGLVPGVGSTTRVLDVGCGTGRQTLLLARNSSARFVAVDSHPPFIDVLNRHARQLGLADRVDARVGDMRQLDFPAESFDVVWCEGAISIMGVEAGLREWRRLLSAGGYMAFTEVCWMRRDPPPECAAFWAREYPAIREPSELLRVFTTYGYDAVDQFPLPPSSWWDEYYRPLEQNVREFRERHHGERDAQELADSVQQEIDVWRACSEFYTYWFFVIRARR